MITVAVLGIGVWGPGLQGWAESLPVLQGQIGLSLAERPPPPALLSPIERRRAGLSVRLALTVAAEASAMAGIPPGAVGAVFGTSNGDGSVVHAILATLASPDPQVSPTQFHNSVHNAAAGYWSIATRSQAPAACIAAHDDTFGAALLRAAGQVATEQLPVLLCVYDTPLPAPLADVRRTENAFGMALVLAPNAAARRSPLMRLRVRYVAASTEPAAMHPRSAALSALAGGNPAARALRLLETLALAVPDSIQAGLLDGRVEIETQPCSAAPK